MKMNAPVRMAILDMNNNVENMGIASIKRIADRFAVVDYDVFDVRYKAEVPGLDYDIYISSGGPGDPLDGDGVWDKVSDKKAVAIERSGIVHEPFQIKRRCSLGGDSK